MLCNAYAAAAMSRKVGFAAFTATPSGVNSVFNRSIASRSRVIMALKAASCGGSGFIEKLSPCQNFGPKHWIRSLEWDQVDWNSHSLVELRPGAVLVRRNHPFNRKIQIGAPVQ